MGIQNNAFGWPEEAIEELRRLYVTGLSCSQIAKAMTAKFQHTISRCAVFGKIDRAGLRRDAPRRPSMIGVSVPKRAGPVRPKAPTATELRRASDAGVVPLRVAMNNHRIYALPEPLPLPPLREAKISSEPKVWTERKWNECTWVVGGSGADSLSCCAPIAKGSWCAAHGAIGFVRPSSDLADASSRAADVKARKARAA